MKKILVVLTMITLLFVNGVVFADDPPWVTQANYSEEVMLKELHPNLKMDVKYYNDGQLISIGNKYFYKVEDDKTTLVITVYYNNFSKENGFPKNDKVLRDLLGIAYCKKADGILLKDKIRSNGPKLLDRIIEGEENGMEFIYKKVKGRIWEDRGRVCNHFNRAITIVGEFQQLP